MPLDADEPELRQAPAPEVSVAPVVQQDVPVHSEWVATLDGYVNAEIRPQVSGYIVKQDYKEGSLVRKGQVLFEIDPRPFKAALDRAKGDLAQAQAQLGKSTLDVERDTPLAAGKAIAKSQLDNEIQAKLGPRPPSNRARRPWSRRNSISSLPKSPRWSMALRESRKSRSATWWDPIPS